MGQLVRAVHKAVQIVILRAVADAVIGGHLAGRFLDVFGARTGVIGANFAAGKAAEQLGYGLTRGLAKQIPQRDVKGRIAPHFRPRRAKAQIPHQISRQSVNFQRVAANHAGGYVFMHMGFHRGRPEKGLAQAHQPLIGMHLQPDQVRPFGHADGFKGCDLHDIPAVSRARTLSSKCRLINSTAFSGSLAATARAMSTWVCTIKSRAAWVGRVFHPMGQVCRVIP